MAGAHGAAIAAAAITSSSAPPAAPTTGKSLVIASSLPSSFPSRRKRTNHLRQKILKTLEHKPYPDISHLERKTSTISIEETELPAESDQLSLSETTGLIDGILGQFSTTSFVKIGLYLVGAFIFQTICAVLIFGSNELKDEDETSNSDDYKKTRVLDQSTSKSKSIETKEGGIVLVDESEMDNRIIEIQEMAREARQQEKVEQKRKGLVEEGDDEVDYDLIEKTMKEKEVDSRLMKMRKSLEGDYEKLPNKFSRKEGDNTTNADKGIPPAEEAFGPLMFKKKYKYKSPSIDSGDKPKGFSGTEADYVANGTKSEISGTSDDNKDQESIDVPINKLVDGSESEKPRATKSESVAGKSKDKQAGRGVKSGKSSNVETRKPRGFGKESQSDDNGISTKLDESNDNGSLKGKKGGNRKSRNLGAMKSSTQTDFWWTSLPYVLAVLMQRGGDSEESEGLFTLKSTSETNNGLSHTVAFEDRSDATNFCYLLESFFDGLGDFSTNIIPIPTNELEEAVKSQIMKVVVVKKGQLQLYVGQPLTDVESALRKLIDEQS